jgi:hypothetical protein
MKKILKIILFIIFISNYNLFAENSTLNSDRTIKGWENAADLIPINAISKLEFVEPKKFEVSSINLNKDNSVSYIFQIDGSKIFEFKGILVKHMINFYKEIYKNKSIKVFMKKQNGEIKIIYNNNILLNINE